VKTERRLVTDAEAAEIEAARRKRGYVTSLSVRALLDTREELIAALEQIEFASTDALSRRRASEILAQVRGE
jgi:hypothetical protein